jgi:acetylornithine deacetylase/succinyl-diaminopimelate desuccinylase-like protein
MDTVQAQALIDTTWTDSIEPCLKSYIAIPNKSPLFDPDWEAHGHMDAAATLLATWCRAQAIKGLSVEVVRLAGRTPLIYVEVAGSVPGDVLLYGHYDKQPEFTGWDADLSPWTPVVRHGRLYGRGGADDGYAIFSSLTAIGVLQAQGIAHARCVLLIEGSEESGSTDLPAYVAHLEDRLGQPELVICLDAECGNYDQFWLTTSLRGNLVGTLSVEMLTEGVHSGMGTGIAAGPMRIARGLLDRIENVYNGDIVIEELHVKTPALRIQEARVAARILGDTVANKLPFVTGAHAQSSDPVELLLNSTWKPTLAITGAEGLPSLQQAGNVLLPRVALKLSLRLPPTLDAFIAATRVQAVLEADPPYGAQVRFEVGSSLSGWHAPPLATWLSDAVQAASHAFYGAEAVSMGTGGSIPFIGMLAERYPNTQFLVTGVLGPHANAHGPNEFLDLKVVRQVTGAVASVLAAHGQARS